MIKNRKGYHKIQIPSEIVKSCLANWHRNTRCIEGGEVKQGKRRKYTKIIILLRSDQQQLPPYERNPLKFFSSNFVRTQK